MEHQVPKGVRRIAGAMPGLEIQTEACSALVYDNGAQLARWAPTGQADVIWLSPRARLAPGASIRGGVPVCFPWFGPAAEGLPQHGFARTSMWQLTAVLAEGEDIVVRYRLHAEAVAEKYRALLPAADVAVELRLGRQACVTLEVAAGPREVEFSAALHAYLGISEVSAVRLTGFGGLSYWDKAHGGTRTGPAVQLLDGETDGIFDGAPAVRVVDAERTIVVESCGAAQTVLWNCGPDKAAEMADMGDAWRSYVCVEAACTGAHALHLGPGHTWRMSATYTVEG